MRSREVVSRHPHKVKNGGASPSSRNQIRVWFSDFWNLLKKQKSHFGVKFVFMISNFGVFEIIVCDFVLMISKLNEFEIDIGELNSERREMVCFLLLSDIG